MKIWSERQFYSTWPFDVLLSVIYHTQKQWVAQHTYVHIIGPNYALHDSNFSIRPAIEQMHGLVLFQSWQQSCSIRLRTTALATRQARCRPSRPPTSRPSIRPTRATSVRSGSGLSRTLKAGKRVVSWICNLDLILRRQFTTPAL
jgi:hypothetical protein